MLFGMGCGEGNDSNEASAVDSGSEADTEQVNTEQEETVQADEGAGGAEQAESETDEITIPELSIEKRSVDEGVDSTAIEFVENMKIGWDLGNTFDAYTDENKADEMAYESDWCGVVTTKEMIDAIKAAGFETIRIPVSWHNHVSDDGNYTISEAWLSRVQEVVDYAMDNDMYIIINIHHDNSTKYMYPSL